jgi:hypothetical protein
MQLTFAKNWLISMPKSHSTSKHRWCLIPEKSLTAFSTRLSEILRHQANLLENIMSEQRYYPDYYRVTFYGNFPQAIQNKRFIVRIKFLHYPQLLTYFLVPWI